MLRRSPLARVSERRKTSRGAYERAVQTALLRDRGCVVAERWPEVECSGRIDPHHVASQRMYPELRCDPENLICACRAHHDAIHAHPVTARALGFLR